MSSSNRHIVTNTGPIIALCAALSDPYPVLSLFDHIIVPATVAQEIKAGGEGFPGIEFLTIGAPI